MVDSTQGEHARCDQRVQPDSDYFSFPKLRWSVCHLREFLPTREISRGIGDSAFGSATVREVMDMTTGVRYSEDYSDPNADIWLYSAAASPLPKPTG